MPSSAATVLSMSPTGLPPLLPRPVLLVCPPPAPEPLAPARVPSAPAAPAPSLDWRAEVVNMLPALRRRAWRWTRSEAEAEDLVQETLLRALGANGNFASQDHLRAWLFTVLRNLFISGRRRERTAERAMGDLHAVAERAAPPAAPFLTRSLERALAALPEAFERVVRLVDLEDYSYGDAASALGVPIGTVMSRLFRGRKRLARELGGGETHAAR